MAELADARDLKSRSRKGVRVRPPLPAVSEKLQHQYGAAAFFIDIFVPVVFLYFRNRLLPAYSLIGGLYAKMYEI